MDWLKRILTGKSKEQIAAEAKKRRQSKIHTQRVRARERELRLAQDGGGVSKATFFFGSPWESYDHKKRGKRTAKNVSSGLMKSN